MSGEVRRSFQATKMFHVYGEIYCFLCWFSIIGEEILKRKVDKEIGLANIWTLCLGLLKKIVGEKDGE